ncbi:MAG: thioredoxin domain-containing protein [Polyangiaceae bacterium]|nr:thioredoxin domain-containing protein [Polyangiaceae bacterium]
MAASTRRWAPRRHGALSALVLLALAGCASRGEPAAAPHLVREGTPDRVNIALARERGGEQAFAFASWSSATFERARKERRFILLHGAAVWCHWCHVMEETTYRDPRVGKLLRDRFVVIRVDVDSRPDIEERYSEWGWPATILLSPDAEELGKYRGYLEPDELLEILQRANSATRPDEESLEPGVASATLDAMPWVAQRALRDFDSYYDAEQGGWGMRQKAPLGENAEFEVLRGARDNAARQRALFSLRQQAALIDPVWGGIYQYSDGSTWKAPHYEKLMTFQAANLAAYAEAYRLTRDPRFLKWAAAIARYVDRFLAAPNSAGYYVSQDADVGAHDRGSRFVDGKIYYAKSEAERLKLGVPRVDTHVYAEESGLWLSALAALGQAGERSALERALPTARNLMKSHVLPDGRVKHAAKGSGRYHLADAASLGFAYVRLAAALRDTDAAAASELNSAALRIATALDALWDEQLNAYWAVSPDKDAAGVFAKRRHPFGANVLTARFLLRLGADAERDWAARGRAVLAAISTPAALDEQGRWLGGYLMALDEAGYLKRD